MKCYCLFIKLILVESGEKMGYQITLFLTLIVYLELVRYSVPIPKDLSDAPKLATFFVIIIILLGFTIMGTYL